MKTFCTILAIGLVLGWCLNESGLMSNKPVNKDEYSLKNERYEKGRKEGIASEYPFDKGIEKNDSVIFVSGFENGLKDWTKYNRDVCKVKSNGSFSYSGSKFLQITATKGKNTGGEISFKFPKGVDQLYLRFYTKFDKNTVMPHHFVKIRAYKPDPYWGNAGHRPKGDEAFWTGIEPSSDRTWHFYTYWFKMHSWQTIEGRTDSTKGPNAYYGNVFEPDNQISFDRNEWICVEAYMKANTPGKSDGEMAFWIDGVRQGVWKPGVPKGSWKADRFVTSGPFNKNPHPFEGFEFRSDSTVKINEIALQWYVTEKFYARGSHDKNIVYFDDVVAATKYIGPQQKK